MRAFFSELEGGWGPQLSTQQEGPPADGGSLGQTIKCCPSQLLSFHYLLILCFLEDEVKGGQGRLVFRKIAHLFMFKIKDLLLVFITGDFLSQKTPWEAY